MSRLFISLYLDEDVDVMIAKLACAYGFDAVTTRDPGNSGATDVEQLEYSTSLGSVLLTHNRIHFESLAASYVSRGIEHAGIIISVRRAPHEIMRRLLRILEYVTAHEMKNQIRYI